MLPEVQLYIDRLRDARAEILKTLDGLNADALNWHPLPDETNSLYALAVHSLGAERRMLHQQVGQQTIERDRAAELCARGEDSAAVGATYAAVTRESEAILARLVAADLDAPREKQTVRWCILHAIEHYHEHLGQMRLTRQLWENRHARPHEI